jgi:hypothetical protein
MKFKLIKVGKFQMGSEKGNAIKLSFFVGWVERSETHRTYENGGFRGAKAVYQLFRELRSLSSTQHFKINNLALIPRSLLTSPGQA